ncbi:hypothetical protein J26TS2_09850 [Shouchella clausii]|nr:hypothetical protein J26TS2_09850 [Shouchella clausii]
MVVAIQSYSDRKQHRRQSGKQKDELETDVRFNNFTYHTKTWQLTPDQTFAKIKMDTDWKGKSEDAVFCRDSIARTSSGYNTENHSH